ncbi:type II secretion system protein [Pokkaliibacter sp. CJK22405]|uniref:type II secretion system protein n=1 Tax=Pokkaliibacter sp. CJK22405 TaxID=3384615 RepID=UPI003984FF23
MKKRPPLLQRRRFCPGAAEAGNRRWRQLGLTLLELVITVAIVSILAGIAMLQYKNYREQADIDQATQDLRLLSLQIVSYSFDNNGNFPASLSDINQQNYLDPWGNPYAYLNIQTTTNRGKVRKDHNLVPINSDFDLYSTGPDGQSSSPLTASASQDDIIRANNGQFYGPADEY